MNLLPLFGLIYHIILKKWNQSCDFVGKKRDIKGYGEENKEIFLILNISRVSFVFLLFDWCLVKLFGQVARVSV